MMKIGLLRHGRPVLPNPGWIPGDAMKSWLEEFNAQGPADYSYPPPAVCAKIKKYKTVLCSDLPRSYESAAKLNVNGPLIREEIFNEAGLPHWNIAGVKLPPYLWLLVLRILWLLGYSQSCESLEQTTQRVQKAAQRIIQLAEQNGPVLVVGHGFINRFIGRKLLACGWCGATNPQKGYWALTEYRLYAP